MLNSNGSLQCSRGSALLHAQHLRADATKKHLKREENRNLAFVRKNGYRTSFSEQKKQTSAQIYLPSCNETIIITAATKIFKDPNRAIFKFVDDFDLKNYISRCVLHFDLL